MGEPDGSIPTNFPVISVGISGNGVLVSIVESQYKETRFLIPNEIMDQIMVARAASCSNDVLQAMKVARRNAETSRLELARAMADPNGIKLETKNVR